VPWNKRLNAAVLGGMLAIGLLLSTPSLAQQTEEPAPAPAPAAEAPEPKEAAPPEPQAQPAPEEPAQRARGRLPRKPPLRAAPAERPATPEPAKPAADRPGSPSKTPARVVDAQGLIEMNFRNVDVLNFIQIMSQAMSIAMVWDEREIKGKITLVSPRKFTKEDAFRIFETVLDMQGFSIVRKPDSPVLQIIPAKDAARFPTPTRTEGTGQSEANYFVTQIIPLRFADPNQIRVALANIMSRTAALAVYAPANVLILSDTQENVQRLMNIIKELDVAPGDVEFAIVALKFASARRLAGLLKDISGPSATPAGPARRGGAQPGQPAGGIPDVRVVADERTNSLVLVGDPFGVGKMKELMALLDVPGLAEDLGIRVFTLQHADAEDLAKILREVRIRETGAGTGGPEVRTSPAPIVTPGAPGAGGGVAPGSTTVTADKSTNSLIVFGSAEYIKTIEQVVKKLDVRRPQVFVQALIMEMTLEKSLDLGVRWQASSQAGDAVLGAGNPNAAPQTLTDALGGGTGAAIGILGNEINFQGQKFVSFSAFIQATRQDQDLNVLANPQILTLNNEEAEINVSQVIPVSAKVVTNIANQTTTEFEFKDVGIILKIKPTITGDDKVRLTINQESSSVAARQTTISATQQAITTLKRKISTHVLVDDGSTMAIGGLIQDQQVETETKVPCLGDIPVLGWFFKSRNESVRKTNLIVFLRPQIIHTRESGTEVTNEAQRRYDATRGLHKDTEDTMREAFGLPAKAPPPDKDAKEQ
jgi:general secretion pathway protein D